MEAETQEDGLQVSACLHEPEEPSVEIPIAVKASPTVGTCEGVLGLSLGNTVALLLACELVTATARTANSELN